MSDGRVVIDIEGDDKNFRRTVSGLGRVASTGVKVVGAAIAATATAAATALAVTISKGATRALDIEDAKATLKSLGYEAEQVAKITENVLASVKGTPYALSDAMSAGASALAAGVKEGKELTSYLKTIGDAATVAKVPFNDMALIFNKVQATGKVSGEIIQQLGERGLPILPMLAESYGVTADELQKMVSRGEVDADRFVKVMREKFGGAALEAGETTRGAIGNLNAALGRLGASLVDKLLPGTRDGISGLISELDRLNPAFAMIGEGLADMLTGGEAVSTRMAVLEGDVKTGSDKVTEGLTTFVTSLVDGINQVLPVAVDVLASLIVSVAEAIPGLIPPLVTALVDGVLSLAEALPVVLPPIWKSMYEAVVTIILALANAIPGLAPPLIAAIISVVPMVVEAGIRLFSGLAESLPASMPLIMDALTDGLNSLLEMLPVFLPPLITAGVELFTGLLQSMVLMQPLLLLAAVTLIEVVTDMLPTLVPILLDAGIELFLALVDAIPAIAPELMQATVLLFMALIRLIPKFAGSLLQAGVVLLTKLVEAPGRVLPALMKSVDKLIKGGAVDVVKKYDGEFRSLGKNIIDGIVSGIGDKVGELKDAVIRAAKAALAAATKILEVNSPSKLFRREVGLPIMEGWEQGISGNVKPVVDSIIKATNLMFDAATDTPLTRALALAPDLAVAPIGYTPSLPRSISTMGLGPTSSKDDHSISVTFNTPVASYSDTVRGVRDAARAVVRR